jgi:NADH:ubiquinone oxidoreductase subunit 5 (subunit L)/multisubunit Na+/H+ antiporter MnhA subunit
MLAQTQAQAKAGTWGAARRNLCLQLVLERLTGQPQENTYVSKAMQDGIEREPQALAIYDALTGNTGIPSGFLAHTDVLAGCSLDVNGVQGAVYQMLAHGISTGGLFLIVGMLSDRRHTRLIAEFGGLKTVAPRLVAAFLLITLASVALPGMNGFVGEFLILIGAFGSSALAGARTFTAVAATGVILSAVYMLWMFQRVNYGPLTNDKNRGLRDLSVREWLVIAPICAMAIFMGVVPGVFLKPMEPAVRRAVERMVNLPPEPANAAAPTAPAGVTVAIDPLVAGGPPAVTGAPVALTVR